jgi:heat shock protein HtpX
MVNLLFRSLMVLALLFGLLFAVGMGVITYLDAPPWVAVAFALGILLLQYLLGPWILQLIYKIRWVDPESVDPDLAAFIQRACDEKGLPSPRFGVIDDGNPNAFTFGHYPGDARLVVTTGLIEMLSSEERKAVVAHELGHIAHWDFVVMTVVAAVPLVLYILARSLMGRGRQRSRNRGGYAVLIGLVSYVAYIVSHYVVLLLSRVREYYADRFAGEVTGRPGVLSTALVKIAYGLAAAPKAEGGRENTRMVAVRAFGVFDPLVAQSLALASAGSGAVSTESMESAMKWDLWNPWAALTELRSTHPLPAKRIRALELQSEAYNQLPSISFRAERPESYLDEFLTDILVSYLPLVGLLAGAGIGVALAALGLGFGGIGAAVLGLCVGAWLKLRFSYRHDFAESRSVSSLISEVKVSQVRSIPCTLEGKIIGRGIPGLFYSEDLVLQDSTGFIVVDYRQPLRFLDFLFGWIKAEGLIGREGQAMGWYRRAGRPYFEMRKLVLSNGETITSYTYPVKRLLLYAGLFIGAVLLVLGAAGVL